MNCLQKLSLGQSNVHAQYHLFMLLLMKASIQEGPQLKGHFPADFT